jgi:hypothetical protein
MIWLIFVSAFVLYFASAYISYHDEWKTRNFYFPLGIFIGLCITTLWFWLIKDIDDKNTIYFYSLIWDAIMIGVFYITPIIIYNVNINKTGLIGLILIIIGLIIFKISQQI